MLRLSQSKRWPVLGKKDIKGVFFYVLSFYLGKSMCMWFELSPVDEQIIKRLVLKYSGSE
ncbi:hypothetical protein DICVIV_00740 [Dictyocaulus viviparus]|uniref:Uncharacterized protein n=1 Tax=Dictyocaulus viviparus TaxID=29172 RepID=A0A0D8Y8K2_DICVI|nr:hypothetical protein DICVIV_00740 [Dictyocaulus viviparus]